MLSFVEEVSHFCLILNTVYIIRVINKHEQFHSYRTIGEYEPDQFPNTFFVRFLVLSILLKACVRYFLQTHYTSDLIT